MNFVYNSVALCSYPYFQRPLPSVYLFLCQLLWLCPLHCTLSDLTRNSRYVSTQNLQILPSLQKPSPCPTSPITFHLQIKCGSVSVLSSAVPRQQKHAVANLISTYRSKYLLPPVLCRKNQLGLSHIW